MYTLHICEYNACMDTRIHMNACKHELSVNGCTQPGI